MTFSLWGKLLKRRSVAGAKLETPGALMTVGLLPHSSLLTEKSKIPLWRKKLSLPQTTKA
jgi:hypothetical protein